MFFSWFGKKFTVKTPRNIWMKTVSGRKCLLLYRRSAQSFRWKSPKKEVLLIHPVSFIYTSPSILQPIRAQLLSVPSQSVPPSVCRWFLPWMGRMPCSSCLSVLTRWLCRLTSWQTPPHTPTHNQRPCFSFLQPSHFAVKDAPKCPQGPSKCSWTELHSPNSVG